MKCEECGKEVTWIGGQLMAEEKIVARCQACYAKKFKEGQE